MSYIKTITGIDPNINAVGVECSMRLEYGELDHLALDTFVAEVGLARRLEEANPGGLRRLAESYGRLEEFDRFEADRLAGREQCQ